MNHMTFSYALDRIKMGAQVTRHASEAGLTIGLDYGGSINVYKDMVYEGPWVPTQTDILANDWSAI